MSGFYYSEKKVSLSAHMCNYLQDIPCFRVVCFPLEGLTFLTSSTALEFTLEGRLQRMVVFCCTKFKMKNVIRDVGALQRILKNQSK